MAGMVSGFRGGRGSILHLLHIAALVHGVAADLRHLGDVVALDGDHDHGVEELHHALVDAALVQLLKVDDDEVLGIGLQELQAPLVQGAGAALAHEQDHGQGLVGGLEGAVEVLAGVQADGVLPLHLHEGPEAST